MASSHDPLTEEEQGSPNARSPLEASPDASSSETKDAPVMVSPLRPVLNRKASGLKFNQHFSFEKVIGSYRIVRKIGKGRYGLVKLGEHITTGTQVAIKIVDKSGLNVVESNSIKTEAEVMTCLNHANVVKLYEVIETKYDLALIMEFAAGGDLFEYVIGKRKLREQEAQRLFVQVVAGLSYCHRHFVVHRDIKAENILLDENQNIRIGDWGFSSVFHPGLNIETACGSLDYAAPEVLTGLVSFGPSVDIWALGVLLFFMLTGQLPFTAPNDFDIYQLIKKGEYKCPKGLSKECKALLKDLLNPDPRTRISISQVEAHPWLTMDLENLTPSPSLQRTHHTAKITHPTAQAPSSSTHSSSSSSSHSSSHRSTSHSNNNINKPANIEPSTSHNSSTSSSHNSHDNHSHQSTSSSSSSQTNSGAVSPSKPKKKRPSTKEKRSISDTKIEQSMHQLKAGSNGLAPGSSKAKLRPRVNSKTKDNSQGSTGGTSAGSGGKSPKGIESINTITEDEEDFEIRYDDEIIDTEFIISDPNEIIKKPDRESKDRYSVDPSIATAMAMTPAPTLPIVMTSQTPGRAGNESPIRHGLRTPTRTFNTEKTKEELAVSKFMILRLNTEQLTDLKRMPQFDILQVTRKATYKEDTLLTVVVATRSTSARKMLQQFEQRRLFRWNSDTKFGLRSRAKRNGEKPAGSPNHSPFRAALTSDAAPSFNFKRSHSPLREHSSDASTSSTDSIYAVGPSTSSPSNITSMSPSKARRTVTKTEDVPASPRSGDRDPPAMRRRKPSSEQQQLQQQSNFNPAPSPSSSTSSSSSGANLNTKQRGASAGAAPPKLGKLAKMRSWSQSEFDNAAPGALKKQMATNAGGSSGNTFCKFSRKRQPDSTSHSYDTLHPDSDHRITADAGEKRTGSLKSHSSSSSGNGFDEAIHLEFAAPKAPSSSPAMIDSPRTKKKKKATTIAGTGSFGAPSLKSDKHAGKSDVTVEDHSHPTQSH